MEFSTKPASPEKDKSDCLIVGVFEAKKLSPSAKKIDEASGKALTEVLKSGDLGSKVGACLFLRHVPNIAADRVLIVNLGKAEEIQLKTYRDALGSAFKALFSTKSQSAALYLTEISVHGVDGASLIEHTVVVAEEMAYAPPRPGMKPSAEDKISLKRVHLIAPAGLDSKGQALGLKRGQALASGQNLTRDLGNLPPNVCTPTYLADTARSLARSHKLKVTVLEEAQMKKLGMNTLLSVSRGSVEPPKFIVLQYGGGSAKQKPIALVGKGITFDTGGISIKPSADMDEMKYDMCGAATVLGTMKSIAEMALPIHLIGIIPTCENMPSGSAARPGDIVTSLSGQTVEILNTDAEGRLILCDALTYTERFKPEAVIDIATLTGACVVALGHVVSGLFSNDEALAQELLLAGTAAHDRAWQLPCWEDYQPQLKSNFADMQNIGSRWGGAITAACFLARFTKAYRWAHLDIAGTAWKSGSEKGATGRPVGLLTHFLMARAKKSH